MSQDNTSFLSDKSTKPNPFEKSEKQGDIKNSIVSESLRQKIKQILQRKKEERRVEILNKILEFDRLQQVADEKNEAYTPSKTELSIKELIYPDELKFPIHKMFRLWLSMKPRGSIPAEFARKCLKVSIELPLMIRSNV